jgi:hypothetical protein
MRFASLICAILALGFMWSAPALGGSDDPQPPEATAPESDDPQPPEATAPGCSETDNGGAEEAGYVRKSGDTGSEDEDAPPKFSNSFYRRWFSMDASTDGFEAPELPVSIEAVHRLPKRLAKQGRQLSEADGVAIVSSSTRIFKDGQQLSGSTATAELECADTVSLKVRLFRPGHWREDEDGAKIPTFRARRLKITD